MAANPDYEFDFYLAQKLGMTVQQMLTGQRAPLSNLEWVEWQIYFGREAQRKQLALAKAKNATSVKG